MLRVPIGVYSAASVRNRPATREPSWGGIKGLEGGTVGEPSTSEARIAHRLLQLGVLLFLLGLLTGFVVPMLGNPRMGLTSHLEGVMNGTFVIVLGLLWPKLRLGRGAQVTGFWLALVGTYTNWGTTLLAGVLPAGEQMMPIASAGHRGTDAQEALIMIGLLAVSIAMIVVSGIVLYGLRGGPTESQVG